MTYTQAKILKAIQDIAHPSIREDLRNYLVELSHLYDIAYRDGQRNMRKAAATVAFNTALHYSLNDASPMLTAERCAEAINEIE